MIFVLRYSSVTILAREGACARFYLSSVERLWQPGEFKFSFFGHSQFKPTISHTHVQCSLLLAGYKTFEGHNVLLLCNSGRLQYLVGKHWLRIIIKSVQEMVNHAEVTTRSSFSVSVRYCVVFVRFLTARYFTICHTIGRVTFVLILRTIPDMHGTLDYSKP